MGLIALRPIITRRRSYAIGDLIDLSTFSQGDLDALMSTGGALPEEVLSGTYAPNLRQAMGTRVAFLGDSITAGSTDNAAPSFGECWPLYAVFTSAGGMLGVRNAGVAGNTTTQMLARFDTDITPYSPTVVNILGGTNDLPGGSLSTFQANIAAMVVKCRTIGALPVLCSIPPSSNAAYTSMIPQWNAWLARYAASIDVPYVDFYAVLTDYTSGNWLSTYLGDGTHPNSAGQLFMGQTWWSAVSSFIRKQSPSLPVVGFPHLSTTLAAAASAGATSISLAASAPAGSSLQVDTGASAERVQVSAISGAGPFTATLPTGLVRAHSSGATVRGGRSASQWLANATLCQDLGASGVGDAWVSAGVSTGITKSIGTDAGIFGKYRRIAASGASAGVSYFSYATTDPTLVVPGNVVEVGGLVRLASPTNGAYISCDVTWFNGGSSLTAPKPFNQITQALTGWSWFRCTLTVPATADGYQFAFYLGGNANFGGNGDLAQPYIRDLTALGLTA